MRPALRFLILAAALLLASSAGAQTTLSASPEIVSPGGTITATWAGIASPSSGDSLWLYPSGGGSYLAWRYTNGAASGSVPFTIPSWTSHGTYVLKLYSGSGGGWLATSNPITVSMTLSGTITMGGAPVAGVTVSATNGATCTQSNALGQYACAISSGWSGTLTPSKASHVFTPASRSYTNVTSSQTGQGYTASMIYQVSGTVTLNGLGLPNVAFAATNGGSCTLSNTAGQYSCTVPAGWTGSVTPSQTGYAFSPTSKSYTAISADDPGEDYTASLSSPTSNISFIHVDHLNTPRIVANSSGTTVWRWDQAEPFGVNVANEDPDGNSVSFEFPLRFPGQYFDKETNLHYNYYRDYDPTLGRYVESDLIGLRGGLNTYAYVIGNPLRYTDRLGLAAGQASLCATGSNNCYLDCMTSGLLACATTTAVICVPVCLIVKHPGCVAACPPVVFTICALATREKCREQCGD